MAFLRSRQKRCQVGRLARKVASRLSKTARGMLSTVRLTQRAISRLLL